MKFATVQGVIDKALELEGFDYRIQFNYSTVMKQFRLQVMKLPEGRSVNQIIFKVTLDIDDDNFREELGFVYRDLECRLSNMKKAVVETTTEKQINTR